MVWRNLPPYHRFQYFVLSFLTKRLWQSVSKHLQKWYRGRLPQTMVDSWYCLDRVVPEGMSQVWRRSEVGKHKRCSLNTRLSSGTSAGTFACPAGPYRKCWGEAGTKNEPNRYFVPDREKMVRKSTENRSSRFEPKILLISFSRGSGPPLNFLVFYQGPQDMIDLNFLIFHQGPQDKKIIRFKSTKGTTYFSRLCFSILRAREGRCGLRGILPISEPTLTSGLGFVPK